MTKREKEMEDLLRSIKAAMVFSMKGGHKTDWTHIITAIERVLTTPYCTGETR